MKKAVSILLAILMLASMLAACGSKDVATQNPNSGDTPAASNEQASGEENTTPAEADPGRAVKDTLNIALAYDISSLDPQVGKEMRACIVSQQIFDTLVQWDPERGMGSEIVPALAESWEYLDDCTLQLKLRQDVLFHNGEKMTADDVVYSIERTMNSKYVAYHATAIDHVEKVDDYTVNIVTKEPYAPLLAGLCVTAFSVVCKSVAEADEEGFAEHPVGTGPYKFVSYTSGDNIQLEAFDDCWRGTPVTKHINMVIIPENSQRTVMLETGEADIAYEILPNDVSRIDENDDLTTATIQGTKTYVMRFNYDSDGPVGNKLVRQAIEYCLDRETMCEVILYGHGNAAYGNVTPASVAYQEVEKRTQDIEKAKELLAEAGYADGFDMNLWISTDVILTQYANIIQSELAKVNINVNIVTLESSALISSTKSDKENFDALLNFANDLTLDSRYYLYNFFYSGSSNNSSCMNNARLDELLVEGRKILNVEDSVEIYKEINDILMDERPEIPLYNDEIIVGLSKDVFGFVPKAQGIHVLGVEVGCYE